MKSETAISSEAGKYLTANGIPNWRVNVLNGQFRGHKEKKWRHVESGTPGISDRQFLLDDETGRTFYLEIKKPGGVQSDDQIAFESECIARGVPYGIAESPVDVQEILEIYGMCKLTVDEWKKGVTVKDKYK